MRSLALVCFLVAAAAVPQLSIDLAQEPEQRWIPVLDYWLNTGIAEALLKQEATAPIKIPEDKAQAWYDAVMPLMDYDTLREIRGFLDYFSNRLPHANVTLRRLLLAQWGYEENYPQFCSGIVAAMPNGTVIHGRNMDYGAPPLSELHGHPAGWSDVTIEVVFKRHGQPLFTSVTWPLQLGIHTAMRYNGWTFEQNTRHQGDHTAEQNLIQIKRGSIEGTLFARKVMTEEADFDRALERLAAAPYAAPQYFVMTGPKPYQAAVLSIDRGGVHDPSTPRLRRLGHNTSSLQYLVQTNDDVNKPALDSRRGSAELRLSSARPQNVSVPWLFNEMRAPPVFSGETVFTWMAVVAKNFSKTILKNETSFKNETILKNVEPSPVLVGHQRLRLRR